MKLLFITGCARTGTTFFADWLATSLPNAFCTKESGILTVCDWSLSSVRFLSRVTDFKEIFVRHVRAMAEDAYKEIGWDGQPVIVDKQPLVLSDIRYSYEHLRLLFKEEVGLVYMVRDPVEVVASMLNRTWGETRGSVLNPRKRGYWSPDDANDFVSPISFRLDPLENMVGDIEAKDGAKGVWSLKKCCLHYRNSVEAVHWLGEFSSVLVCDYNRLADSAYQSHVIRSIERMTEQDIHGALPFEHPNRHNPLDSMTIDAIRSGITDAGWKDYRALVDLADSQFEAGVNSAR